MPSPATRRRTPASPTPTPLRTVDPPRGTLAEAEEYARVLWFGNPGYMKTTCAATMACLGRVIYVDAERRLKPTPLRRVGEKIGVEIPLDNIEVVTDVSYPALLTLTEEIRDRLRDGEPIVGFVWDSVSEQHRELLEDCVDDSIERAAAKGEWRHPTRLFQEDYGDMTEQMRRILRRLRDLPIHIGLTALPRHDVVQGVSYTTAGVTPAVLRDIQGMMDFIIHMRYEAFSDTPDDDEYSGLCRPQGSFDAKDTFGVLPVRMVEPTFVRLHDYMKGNLTAKTDPLQIKARERRLQMTAAEKEAAKTAIKEGTD